MVNDETLCAYIDGELDADAHERLDRIIAVNPGIALRLEQLRRADDALRAALAPDEEPKVVPFTPKPAAPSRDWSGMARRWAPLAAASLIGVLVGMFAPTPYSVGDPAAVSAALSRVLDETPSGEIATLANGNVILAQTLITDEGIACRQYRIEGETSAVDSVACREDGAWRLRAQLAVAEAPNTADYQAAGADSADPLTAAVDALGNPSVLDETEEAQAIASEWRRLPL